MKTKKNATLFALVLSLLLLAFAPAVQSASISGTVADSAGNPIDGSVYQIQVNALQGTPCGWLQWFGYAMINPDGSYAIQDLPAGTYYLQTNNMNQSNYVNEWWTGGAPDPSGLDCNSAEALTVAADDAVPGKDFRLETGGTVTGAVFQSDGTTPITDVPIAITPILHEPSGRWVWMRGAWTNQADGTYKIMGVPSGLIHLHAESTGANYLREFWAEPESVLESSGAGAFTLSPGGLETNKDFQLDVGGTISGTVTGSGPLQGITVAAVPFNCYLSRPAAWPDCARYVACTDIDGDYALRGLPYDQYLMYAFGPGDCQGANYLAEFYPEKERQADASPVTISSSSLDASGIDFTLDLLDDAPSTPGLNIFRTGGEKEGVFTWDLSGLTLLIHQVLVVDHDGILADGGSHAVSVQYPGGAIKPLSLTEKWDLNAAVYQLVDLPNPPLPGEYIYQVIDSANNTSTVTDSVQIDPLAEPDINTFSPTAATDSITAYFDNISVNNAPYDDFSAGAVDPTKWTSMPSWAEVVSGQLEITQSSKPGSVTQWLWLQNPTAVQSISADVKVTSITSDSCEAGIGGSFANDGLGDLFAYITVTKDKISYSVLRVSDWYNFYFEVLASEDILSATQGVTYRLTLQWDGSAFTFFANETSKNYIASGSIQEPMRYTRGIGTRILNRPPNASPTFDWDPVPGAKSYGIRIYDNRDHALYSFSAVSPPFTIAPGDLEAGREYKYRIQAYRDHHWFELDSGSEAPGSSSDYISFHALEERQEPYTYIPHHHGVYTVSDSFMGPYLGFMIEVSDAQGVPDNIKSVTVTFPDGSTQLPLYFDHSITPFKAVYRNNYYGQIQNNTYTFRIEDKDGNVFQTSEDFTSNPVGYPSEDSLTANGDASYHSVIGGTGLTIAWAGVPEATFYEVNILDKELNDLYWFKTENAQFTIPPGLLAENALYSYSIHPHGEYFENNAQNRAVSPWIPLMFKSFLTTPFLAGPGGSSPTLTLTGQTEAHLGVATFHVRKATTGEDRYQLVAIVKVTDPDGVPRNIQSVQVQYPGQTEWEDMIYYQELSPTEAEYIRIDTFTSSTQITPGTYTFKVTDCDDNFDEDTDNLVVNILPIVSTSTPGQGTVISGTTPTITWSNVGSSRYQVRIYDNWLGNTIHWSDYLTETTYTVPEGVLEFDKSYHYQIYAYREEGSGEDIDNYSIDHLYPGERSAFTTRLLGDVNGDLVVDLTDALIALQILVGITPSQVVNLGADVNGDGKIGIQEAFYVLQKVSGLR